MNKVHTNSDVLLYNSNNMPYVPIGSNTDIKEEAMASATPVFCSATPKENAVAMVRRSCVLVVQVRFLSETMTLWAIPEWNSTLALL